MAIYSHPVYAVQKDDGMNSSEEFLAAVTKGEAAKVKELLEQDPSLARASDKAGVTAILLAAYYRKPAIVDLLLASGIELNIFEASATGQTGRAQALIKEDRELVNAYSPDGFYPLGLAAFFGHKETAKALLASGAEVNMAAKNPMKVMPLHAAAAARQIEIARWLLERGAAANAQQQGGITPLHEAAAHGDVELAKLLLAHKADVNIKSEQGKTALRYALENKQAEMATFLKERGAVE